MDTSFWAKLFLFVLASEFSSTFALTCKFSLSLFMIVTANCDMHIFRRLDEADYDTVFTTLTHLPQDMNEESVCSYIKEMHSKIPAQE
jgi:hypothetical protein